MVMEGVRSREFPEDDDDVNVIANKLEEMGEMVDWSRI